MLVSGVLFLIELDLINPLVFVQLILNLRSKLSSLTSRYGLSLYFNKCSVILIISHLCSGFFLNIPFINLCHGFDIVSGKLGYSQFIIFVATSFLIFDVNGNVFVSIAYIIQPRLHTSNAGFARLSALVKISGAI